ncbi:hypothetical protein lerEdw1_011425, partial [Lerista edwardsae]
LFLCEYKAQIHSAHLAVGDLVLSGKEIRSERRSDQRYQAESSVIFRTGPRMEPVLLQRRAKLLHLWVFRLTLLALRLVSLKACDHQKGSAEPSDCLESKSISVQEGDSIHISIPFEQDKEVVDLCIWRRSASCWENTCQFSDSGTCQPLLMDFKEHITLGGKTLTLHNVSRAATGIYKVQQSGKCVAWRNVTVEEAAEPRDCLDSANISVQEGGSRNMSVPFEHEKEPVDLYIWRGSASRWEKVCHFSNDSGICHTAQNYFKEHITLEGKTLMLHNASREATGIYKVLLMSGKCVTWRNVTMEEEIHQAYMAKVQDLQIVVAP